MSMRLTESEQRFVATWQEVWKRRGTVSEVASKLGRSRTAVGSRAAELRRAGVKLGKFPPGGFWAAVA